MLSSLLGEGGEGEEELTRARLNSVPEQPANLGQDQLFSRSFKFKKVVRSHQQDSGMMEKRQSSDPFLSLPVLQIPGLLGSVRALSFSVSLRLRC